MNYDPDIQEIDPVAQEVNLERQKRKEIENSLNTTNQRFERIVNTIPCVLYDYVFLPNNQNRFIYVSPQCKDLFEYSADQITNDSSILWNLVHHDDLERLKREDREANLSKKLFQSEVRVILPSGDMKWIQLTSRPSTQKYESYNIWCGVILDITQRKTIEEERNQLVADLKNALAKVKTLSGLLPICASCKSIRDDQGYWNHLENYISSHSEVEFSHSICPSCAKKLYPDLKNE